MIIPIMNVGIKSNDPRSRQYWARTSDLRFVRAARSQLRQLPKA